MKKDFLYKISEKLYAKGMQKQKGRFLCTNKVRQGIVALYPGDEENHMRLHVVQKLRKTLCIFLIGIGLSLAVGLSGRMDTVIKGNRIDRTDYGGRSQEIPVIVTLGEEQQSMVLQVGERQYTEKELEQKLAELIADLGHRIQGENRDLEHVKSDLKLDTSFPDYPFQITWECQDYSFLDSDGTVKNADLPPEGKVTGINGVFTYKDFRAEHLFYIHVYPPDESANETVFVQLQEALTIADNQTKYEQEMILPTKLNEMEIVWKEKKEKTWLFLLIFTGVITVVIYFTQDQDVYKQLEKRDVQLKQDYSQLVSKLSIYMGAGMSARQAWEKIANDYEQSHRTKKERHYLYEEVGITCQEMKSGVSEITAYDHFGKRCRLQLYLKFSSLLVQNLRKGTTSLGKILKEESRIAFEDRKNEARKRGEEAGTKMLIPMMLMLCMVMIMIMVPAFLTF